MENTPKELQVLQVHPDVKKYAAAFIITTSVNEEEHTVTGWIISLEKKFKMFIRSKPVQVTVSIDDVEPVGFAHWSPDTSTEIEDERVQETRMENEQRSLRTGPEKKVIKKGLFGAS